ncbi:MAG: 2OG-Fe(II) oxygenase family protein [Roseivirga sp.]
MDKRFDGLVDSYLENRVGLVAEFLGTSLSANLKANLLTLHLGQQLLAAKTGNNANVVQDSSMRGDLIYWLDRKHNDLHENSFFELMDLFVIYLNETCYTGITGYEFHYALYEKGSFYRRHLDQFQDDKGRAYSMIMYLNTDWQQEDGGELCIHHAHHRQVISPLSGKCVFFKSSELEHEVLLSHEPRLSITGWLKTD